MTDSIKFSKVDSSNINRVAFDDGLMYVEYKAGNIYRYEGVPKSIYESFLKAESKGRFMNSEIKGKYTYSKIPDPTAKLL